VNSSEKLPAQEQHDLGTVRCAWVGLLPDEDAVAASMAGSRRKFTASVRDVVYNVSKRRVSSVTLMRLWWRRSVGL